MPVLDVTEGLVRILGFTIATAQTSEGFGIQITWEHACKKKQKTNMAQNILSSPLVLQWLSVQRTIFARKKPKRHKKQENSNDNRSDC